MKRIVITGADGFLGTHLHFFLHEKERRGDVSVTPVSRSVFNDPAALASTLRQADVVFHLAGINRGTDEELEAGNIALADALISAARASGTHAHILFSSSIHEERDTAYGRGKKTAAERLRMFGEEANLSVTVLVLPNLFGEFANPEYNSVVATFCHDLAEGRSSTINPEGTAELLYVYDAVVAMWESFENGTTGRVSLVGTRWRIPDLYERLAEFDRIYRTGTFPDVADRFELSLFNTLHSYLFNALFPLELEVKTDERGSLFEIERSGRADQVFYSTTKPGKARGEHYHTHKMERFCVVQGEAEISVRRLLTDEKKTFKVSGDIPTAIDMPTYHTHSLTNVGKTDLRAVFWISEQYDPEYPDTFAEPV